MMYVTIYTKLQINPIIIEFKIFFLDIPKEDNFSLFKIINKIVGDSIPTFTIMLFNIPFCGKTDSKYFKYINDNIIYVNTAINENTVDLFS